MLFILPALQMLTSAFCIPLASSSQTRTSGGKSGGARVITHFKISKDTVYLLSIFDKSDTQNIHDNDIIELLKQID